MEEHESVDSHTGDAVSVTGDPQEPPTVAENAPETIPDSAVPARDAAVDGDPVPGAAGGGAESEREEGGLDPQLIALCVVLWIVAMGVFAFQWKGMRTDYYLGNVKETLDLENRLDQESLETLVALATEDPEVLDQLRRELESPQRVNQQYRVAVLVAIQRVPGPRSLEVVAGAAKDYDPRVRSNAYQALSRRIREGAPEERERAYQALVGGLEDSDPQARAFAANFLGEAGDRRAVWPLIKLLRQSEGDAGLAARETGLRALRQLTAVGEDALAFDPRASRDERDRGLRAWEAWFRGQGGEVPPGEGVDEVRAAEPAPTPAPAPDGMGGTGEPDAKEGAQPETVPAAPAPEGELDGQSGSAPRNPVEGIPNGG